MLKKLRHHVDVATNGREALELFAASVYDLVLMDVQMPEMDGLEATRRIHQICPIISCPPIIALTANAMVGDEVECLAAGMDGYLKKPLKFEELKRLLGRIAPGTHSGDTPDPE
jgi:CheY-like chemotaxis protein